jgi:hypothetical protein
MPTSLAKLIYSTEFDDRFHRVESFLDYLNEHEHRELAESGIGDKKGAFGPFMPQIKTDFHKQKADIIKRVRLYERNLKD